MLSYLRKKMKTIMIIVAVLFVASMFYGLGYQGLKEVKGVGDKGSIAKVNGKEIDHARFIRTVNSMYAGQKERIKPQEVLLLQTLALNQVIDFTIMLEGSKKKVRTSGREVDQAIMQIMEANKITNIAQLKASLKNTGINYNDFKNIIKDEITVSKMNNKLKSEVVIGPDDLRQVKARHILIIPKYTVEVSKNSKAEIKKADEEAKAKAEEILSKIKQGQSFSALAKQYSDDTQTKVKGGDLGYFTTGTMAPEFEKAAFSLKPGEVSEVVKTAYGYHIIKVDDTRLRTVPTKEGRDISEIILEEKQNNALRNWFMEAKQKAKVEINNPLLKAYSMAFSGNINEAVAILQQEVSQDTYNSYKHLFLAELYLQTGKMDLAIFEYKRAAEIESSNPDFLISLGNAYLAAKKANVKLSEGGNLGTMAVEQFRKASLIAGDNKEVHKELKDIFNKYGYTNDAAKEKSEISRIERKEKFEEEIRSRATLETQ